MWVGGGGERRRWALFFHGGEESRERREVLVLRFIYGGEREIVVNSGQLNFN